MVPDREPREGAGFFVGNKKRPSSYDEGRFFFLYNKILLQVMSSSQQEMDVDHVDHGQEAKSKQGEADDDVENPCSLVSNKIGQALRFAAVEEKAPFKNSAENREGSDGHKKYLGQQLFIHYNISRLWLVNSEFRL